METKEKFVKILDDYYGSSRHPSLKEEIAEFIESYYEDIKRVMEDADE